SRTDLLHVGRVESRARPVPPEPGEAATTQRSGQRLLTFPEGRTVAQVMKRDVVGLGPDASVSIAARMMVERRIHRVSVMEAGALLGVLSTKDVLAAIRDKRVSAPIGEAMSAPVFTIPLRARLSLATDRLERAHVSGLCVVDETEWPVGTFTQ